MIEVYDADMEEPNCGECDHLCSDDDIPCMYCGSEYGWKNYRRSVGKTVDTDEQYKDSSDDWNYFYL